MAKIISIIVVVLLLIGLNILVVWEYTTGEKTLEADQIVKYIVAMVGGILTLVRLFRNERRIRRPLSFYEKHYEKQIGNAFKNDKKSRRKLLECYRLYNEDRYKAAIRLVDSLKSKSMSRRDDEAIYFFKGFCYEELKMIKESIDSYTTAIKINPQNSSALSNLGLIYLNSGDYDNASLYFESAINAAPDSAQPYNNLASVFFRKGEYERTIELALKAYEYKPSLYQAASLLAMSYSAVGNGELSEKYYKIAVANGENANALKSSIERLTEVGAVNMILDKWSKLTSKESVYISLGANSGRSVVGGRLNEEAPLDSDGRHMRLLSAIFFSEMPHIECFPRQGVLRFYIADNERYGADFNDPTTQKDFRVLYDEDESRFLSGPYRGKNESFPVRGSYRISFKKTTESMPLDTMGAYELMESRFGVLGDEIEYEVGDRLVVEESKLGGYPHFTQYDVREGNYEQYDTLLFQLTSADLNGENAVMFGDWGVCNFFISKRDLLRCDFTNVLYTWDCC